MNMVQSFSTYYEEEFGYLFVNIDTKDDDDSLDINDILENEKSLRYCLLMMRYFVSRIQPFDGMHTNSALQWLDTNIASTMEVLMQLHCYKTLSAFVKCVKEGA
eukprot:360832_1